MTIHLGKTLLRVHPLLPCLWGAALVLGGPHLLPIFAAFALHEAGHFAAARLLSTPIDAVEITPLGGRITMESIQHAPPRAAFILAAGGPLFSLLGCLAAPLVQHLAGFSFASVFARQSLLLLCVNLLPVLPLDGGRMLRAVLSHFLPYATATRWLIRAGYGLGFLMCAFSVGAAVQGRLQFFPAFAGLYLIYAAAMENRQTGAWLITHWISRRQKIQQKEILSVAFWAAGAETPLHRVVHRFSPGKYNMVYVLSPDGMRQEAVLQEETLCACFLENSGQTLQMCIKKRGSG